MFENFSTYTAGIPEQPSVRNLGLQYQSWSQALISLGLLNRNESELVGKVVESQKLFSVKNDWALQVHLDLEKCEINLTELEISKMKRLAFKKLVNEKIQKLAAKYLISLKQKHSKSEHLKYSTSMQPYLRNESLKLEEKKLMFRCENELQKKVWR